MGNNSVFIPCIYKFTRLANSHSQHLNIFITRLGLNIAYKSGYFIIKYILDATGVFISCSNKIISFSIFTDNITISIRINHNCQGLSSSDIN